MPADPQLLQRLRSRIAAIERGDWGRLRPVFDDLHGLQDALRALADALAPLEGGSRELASCHDRARARAETLDLLLADEAPGVRWFSCRRGRLSLTLTPLDIAEEFRKLRSERTATWIMTSATLAVNGRFDHLPAA